MAITLFPHEISAQHRPFVASRGLADGRVTLYYSGDEVPALPEKPTPGIVRTSKQLRDALGPQTWRQVWKAANTDDAALDFTVMLFTATDGIAANDPNYIAAVNYLRSKNWITEAKKLELLA